MAKAKASQVLVVGAGPTGLVMAHELARHGTSVRVIDKAAEPSQKSKALLIQVRSQEILEMMGVAAAMEAQGKPTSVVNIYFSGEPKGRVEFSGIESPYPFPLVLPQNETEKILIEALGKRGVEVERQVEMTEFFQDEQSVVAHLRKAGGKLEEVCAPY